MPTGGAEIFSRPLFISVDLQRLTHANLDGVEKMAGDVFGFHQEIQIGGRRFGKRDRQGQVAGSYRFSARLAEEVLAPALKSSAATLATRR